MLLVVIKLEGGIDSDLVVLDCLFIFFFERRRFLFNFLMFLYGDDMIDLLVEGKKEGIIDLLIELVVF